MLRSVFVAAVLSAAGLGAPAALAAAWTGEGGPKREPAAGERVAQYTRVLPRAEHCPRRSPSQESSAGQYVIWQCVRNGRAQYDFYRSEGYSHSLILPN